MTIFTAKLRRTLALLLLIMMMLGWSQKAYSQPPKPTIIYIVRHAERDYNGPDPHLNQQGKMRAHELAKKLKSEGIQYIFVTEFLRTQETAMPLSQMTGISISKREKSAKTQVANNIKNGYKSAKVLMVAHSDTIPAMVKVLANKTVNIKDNQYNRIFIVTIPAPGKTGSLQEITYGH